MGRENNNLQLSRREKVAVIMLLFIVKLINPTGYTHEIDALIKEIKGNFDDNLGGKSDG